jgi:hypothetical protein
VDPKTYGVEDEVKTSMYVYRDGTVEMQEIERRLHDQVRTELGTHNS